MVKKRGSKIKAPCPVCGKMLTKAGLVGHLRFGHGVSHKVPSEKVEKPLTIVGKAAERVVEKATLWDTFCEGLPRVEYVTLKGTPFMVWDGRELWVARKELPAYDGSGGAGKRYTPATEIEKRAFLAELSERLEKGEKRFTYVELHEGVKRRLK